VTARRTDKEKIFPQIITVKSSAGSGKTYSLAKRYIGLLFSEIVGNSPIKTDVSNIVAITFTNKAANEMQSRIIEWMKTIILDRTTGESLSSPINEVRSEVSNNSDSQISDVYIKKGIKRIFEDLLENYHDFKVCTIDSFVHLTLKASAFKLGLQPDFDISKESSMFLDAVLQKMLKDVMEDGRIKGKLDRFLFNYLSIEGEKASWFPKHFIKETIATLWHEETKDNKGFYIHKKIGDFECHSNEVRKKVLELLRYLTSDEQMKPEKRFLDALEQCYTAKDYDFIKSAYFKRQNLSDALTKKSGQAKDAYEMLWREIRGSISKYVEAISISKFAPYLEIYLEFKNIFEKEVMQQKRTVLIEQLNMLLQRIIEDEYFIPEIYYALSERYAHFLIDEFQDTNQLQWKNIEVLAEEAIARGGTLFFVGDKKQSIYQWRGGKPDLVDQVMKKFSHYDVEERILDCNYRSHERIVQFNNILYDPENLLMLVKKIIGDATEKECEKIISTSCHQPRR